MSFDNEEERILEPIGSRQVNKNTNLLVLASKMGRHVQILKESRNGIVVYNLYQIKIQRLTLEMMSF